MLGRELLQSWLNCLMKISLSDGRVVVGRFVCTDSQCNVILASCHEFLPVAVDGDEEPAPGDSRFLGLAMVPGRHIVEVYIREKDASTEVSVH